MMFGIFLTLLLVSFVKGATTSLMQDVAAFFLSENKFTLLPDEESEFLEDPIIFNGSVQAADSFAYFGHSTDDITLYVKIIRRAFNLASMKCKLIFRNETFVGGGKAESSLSPSNCWSTEDLKYETIEPMKTSRIVFSGRLTKANSNGDQTDFIRFNLIWHASSGPIMFGSEGFVALEKISPKNKKSLFSNYDGFEQWGTLIGTLDVVNNQDSLHQENVHFQACRQRRWSFDDKLHMDVTLLSRFYKFSVRPPIAAGEIRSQESECYCHHQRSNRLHELVYEPYSVLKKLLSLHKLDPQGTKFPTNCAEDFYTWLDESEFEKFPSNVPRDIMRLKTGVLSDSFSAIVWPKDEMDCLRPSSLTISRVLASELASCAKETIIVSLNSIECCQKNLVGNKAASLAIMMFSLKLDVLKNVTIPNGICLTTLAMKQQVNTNPDLKKVICLLDGPEALSNDAHLRKLCERAVELWKSTCIIQIIKENLHEFLDPDVSYAIRSSGIDEDGRVTSAAGQNETVLNVIGTAAVLEAVQSCWASLYSYRSVKFRRQHGLSILSTMGVIIQKMVLADKAGVMFTRHPVSGDPAVTYITAINGLGDDVVAGKLNPDSVSVSCKDNNFSMVFEKSRYFQQPSLEGESSERKEASACLSTSQIKNLVKIGHSVQELFGFSIDIEWAHLEDKVYILQARPITSLYTWTDFEIIHEFDTPITEDDISTTHNAGEVFPTVVTPLTLSTIGVCVDNATKSVVESDFNLSSRYRYALTVSHNRVLINLMMTLFKSKRAPVSDSIQKISEVILCGKIFSTDLMHHLAYNRNGTVGLAKALYTLFTCLKALLNLFVYFLQPFIDDFVKFLKKYKKDAQFSEDIVESCEDVHKLIADLNLRLYKFQNLTKEHCRISLLAFLSEIIVMSILMGDKFDFTNDYFSDLARLMMSLQNNGISTQIPNLLEDICTLIMNSKNSQDFITCSPAQGQEYLRSKYPSVLAKINLVIEKYGHRGLNELELMTDNWKTKPELFTQSLQLLIKNKVGLKNSLKQSRDPDLAEIKMKTHLPLFSSLLLRCAKFFSQKLVQCRESSKNRIVGGAHEIRLVSRELGDLMVKKGFIPDPSLIYFMSFYQLNSLLNRTRSTIIQRAIRRKKLWPDICDYIFPEISIGLPKPTKFEPPCRFNDLELEGTPIFPGSINGRACVVKSIDDCDQIQNGDILITPFLDIGWSPFFPLLRGVISEIGGLLSHGAVIVRECGIPCIVDVSNATKVFKTGDFVLLDTQKGKISKLHQESGQEIYGQCLPLEQ